jgi:K+-transporting ATPase ATPase C chain
MKNIIRSLALYTICCLLIATYTLFVYRIGMALWPDKTSGSLMFSRSGKIVGSSLLGQNFYSPSYFKSRPTKLVNEQCSLQFYLSDYKNIILSRIEESSEPINIEMIVPSASLLDPYISLEAALSQIPQVAKYADMSEKELENLVKLNSINAQWPFFDMSIVNITKLNAAIFYTKEVQPTTILLRPLSFAL